MAALKSLPRPSYSELGSWKFLIGLPSKMTARRTGQAMFDLIRVVYKFFPDVLHSAQRLELPETTTKIHLINQGPPDFGDAVGSKMPTSTPHKLLR